MPPTFFSDLVALTGRATVDAAVAFSLSSDESYPPSSPRRCSTVPVTVVRYGTILTE